MRSNNDLSLSRGHTNNFCKFRKMIETSRHLEIFVLLYTISETNIHDLLTKALSEIGSSNVCEAGALGAVLLSRILRQPTFCICENKKKTQISCAVTAQPISALVFSM